MKRNCLWCNDEYEAKKETSKYCSTSCRVMYNHKYSKKGTVTKLELTTLYNEFKAAIQELPKMQYVTPISQKQSLDIYNATHPDQFTSVETIKNKSFQEHMNEIAELDTPYEYEMKTKEIQVSNLTEKQKNLLYLNMKSAKF